MANGEMLTELRRMAETSDLSVESAQRLTLSALAEMYTTMKTHMAMDQGLQHCMEDVSDKVDTMSVELVKLKKQLDDTNSNPLVAFGRHIKDHPKMAAMYVFIALVFITWLPYFNLVRLILLWAGVPNDIVDLITPTIGVQ